MRSLKALWVLLLLAFASSCYSDHPLAEEELLLEDVQADCSVSITCPTGVVVTCNGTNSQCFVQENGVACNGVAYSCPPTPVGCSWDGVWYPHGGYYSGAFCTSKYEDGYCDSGPRRGWSCFSSSQCRPRCMNGSW